MVQTILHSKPVRDKTKIGIHIDFTKDDKISSFRVNKNLVNRKHPFTPFQVKLLSALATRYIQSVPKVACLLAGDVREQTKLRLAGTVDQKSAEMRKALDKAYKDNRERLTKHPPAICMRFKGLQALETTFGVSRRDVAKVKATLLELTEISETVTWHVAGNHFCLRWDVLRKVFVCDPI